MSAVVIIALFLISLVAILAAPRVKLGNGHERAARRERDWYGSVRSRPEREDNGSRHKL
jgi:hypothetical protein